VYDSWPEHVPAAFVSFDRPRGHRPLQAQIDEALSLFDRYPHQLHTFLIKPEPREQHVKPDSISARIEALKAFNILGLTEKEAGSSVLKRMQNIAAIRFALDDAEIRIPIHVFGSLDPITSVLYFLAGAEIFDGLTWLRYGYAGGFACYQSNYCSTEIGIDEADDELLKARCIQQNLRYLKSLAHEMQMFLLEGNFEMFTYNGTFFRRSFDLLRTKIRRTK
jgi:hypothetical protein